MEQVVYIRLDRTQRVIFKNFWYITQAKVGGTYRKQSASRDLAGAVAVANMY